MPRVMRFGETHHNGFVADIEQETVDNDDYRRVLFTADNMQLVLMSLRPGEDIGSEIHMNVDQFFRFEAGNGISVINGEEHEIKDGDCIIVPKGARHNIINTGVEDLKLYSLYSPPNHPDGLVQSQKDL